MNEHLLKAITRLFAVVSKERVTEAENSKLKEFLHEYISSGELQEYLEIFDSYQQEIALAREQSRTDVMDLDTEDFVEEWAEIVIICKRINLELTSYQKYYMMLKLVELVLADEEISERQENVLYNVGKLINVDAKSIKKLQKFVLASETEHLSGNSYMVIDDLEDSPDYPYKHICTPLITGFIGLIYLKKIDTYFIKYIGISPLRLNGLPLRSRRIHVFPPGSIIRGNKIEPIFYSDIIHVFFKHDRVVDLQLKAMNLSYKFPEGMMGLRDIYVDEPGGNFVGIMGASGSGKTTLLEVLNGKKKPFSGTVLINGVDVHEEPEKVEGLIGYVPQFDMLIESLTVYENLYYAAKLSFGNLEEDEIQNLVNRTLANLGLSGVKDLKVGSALRKTISGGQRKRLNIALELIREPSILFVDEPTSGLSSRDSETIMDLLKDLSLKGKLVFVIIHQPSSDIFKMFNRVIILDVGGYQIYYNNPVEALVRFREYLNMVNRDQGACITCGNVKVEQIFDIIETKEVDEYGRLTDRRKYPPKIWNQYFNKFHFPNKNLNKKPLPKSDFKVPSWKKQLKVFISRDVKSKLSNTQYMIINLLEAPMLALILGFFIRYYDPGVDGNQKYTFFSNINIPAYFFMSVIVALFIGLTVSAEEIFRDREIHERERYLNLSKSSYLMSKLIILFVLSAIQTLSFVFVGDYLLAISEFQLPFWIVLFTSAFCANVIGLNISSAFDSVVTIYILIPLALIPQLVFSGIVFEFDKLNPDVSRQERVPLYGEMMASRWAFEAIVITQFKDNPFGKFTYPFDKSIAQSEYKFAYYLPEISTYLEKCLHADTDGPTDSLTLANDLELIRNELGKELDYVGRDKLPSLEKLTPDLFDSTTYQQTKKFIENLRKMYIKRFDKAKQEKQKLIEEHIATDEDLTLLYKLRSKYRNQQIENLVKNAGASTRIVRSDNHLIRKIYPIYFDPENPRFALDFQTHFYAPTKYFAGLYIDTFWFNVMFLWLMSAFMIVALYFEWLRKIVQILGRLFNIDVKRQVRMGKVITKRKI